MPVEMPNWIEHNNPTFKSTAADISQWWKVFDDPVLEELITKAYEQNLSLQAAGIRILEARAQLGISTGNLYPQSQAFKCRIIMFNPVGWSSGFGFYIVGPHHTPPRKHNRYQ